MVKVILGNYTLKMHGVQHLVPLHPLQFKGRHYNNLVQMFTISHGMICRAQTKVLTPKVNGTPRDSRKN